MLFYLCVLLFCFTFCTKIFEQGSLTCLQQVSIRKGAVFLQLTDTWNDEEFIIHGWRNFSLCFQIILDMHFTDQQLCSYDLKSPLV
jgi:hypothetical protein